MQLCWRARVCRATSRTGARTRQRRPASSWRVRAAGRSLALLPARCAATACASPAHARRQVTGATFDKAAGLWTVTAASGASVKGRVLVCADGATSQLATKLGYCTEAPRGVCSRAFVSGGTHNANFDGVCFYPKWSLPGYAALFK